MSSDRYDMIPIEGIYEGSTKKAVYLNVGGENIWFPLSQVETPELGEFTELGEFDRGEEIEILCPRWLAEEKGIG